MIIADRSRRHLVRRYLLLTWLILSLLSLPVSALELPAGTTLEVRLSTPTGSRISRVGDQVEGSTIAPIAFRGQILVPQGSKLIGSVDSVKRFGLGLKQVTARIHYQFHTLRLPNRHTIPIHTEVGCRFQRSSHLHSAADSSTPRRGLGPWSRYQSFLRLRLRPLP